MTVFVRSGAKSRLALAVALATGAATIVSQPAFAQGYGSPASQNIQQPDQGKKKQDKQAQKTNYSKGFAAAYVPIQKPLEADDLVSVQPAIAGLIAAAETADDKLLAGQIAYRVGLKASDTVLEKAGLDLMLASGLADPKLTAQMHYRLGEMAFDANDFETARARAQQALDVGYGVDGELLLARTYVAQNQTPLGLERLDKAIAAQIAAGQPVPESWLKFGVANADKARLGAQAVKYAAMWAQYYPSSGSWGDTIAIYRNAAAYEPQEQLDLLRLAQRVNALRAERDYLDYISAADARRLPGETQKVIDAGLAAGLLKGDDEFVSGARSIAASRIKADEADLTNLAREARLPNATGVILTAAGDASLSYGRAAEAEEFYTRALTRPGVDTARIMTRLGIAQLDQGKTAEAQANFARVEGARQAIAGLWSLYAAQAAKGSTTPQL